MKKKWIRILLPVFVASLFLAGCQKAPEVSDDDEILRAKGSLEEAVEEVVNAEEEAGEGDRTPMGTETVNIVLGDGENSMRIEAEIAAAPEEMSTLTMQADSRLGEETLLEFLDPQGEVRDITAQVLAEEEAERQRVAEIDEKLGEGSSIVEIAGVGDGSRLALTDGNRTAHLVGKTGGSYEDALLMEKCRAVAKEEAQKLDGRDAEAGDSVFSLSDAKALLIQKLSVLGITDIFLTNVYFYRQDGFLFYEMQFVPVVDGIPIAYSFGQKDITGVYPDGIAWVCAEGVSQVGLWNCCMEQVSVSEKEKILSFDKVRELLEIYLEDGSLQCTGDVPFSTVQLVYYVELRDGKLELVPMWSIHMDLGEYVEYCGQTGENDSVWTIHIDAVTGAIVQMQ